MVTIEYVHDSWDMPIRVDVEAVPRLHEVVDIEYGIGVNALYQVSGVCHQIDDLETTARARERAPGSTRPTRRAVVGMIRVRLIRIDGGTDEPQKAG